MLTLFKQVSPSFSIESLAHPFEQSFPNKFDSVGEFYNFIEIFYLKSGKAEIVIEKKIYHIDSGSIIFFAPMHLHKYRNLEDSPLKTYTLSMKINGNLPKEIFDTPFLLDSAMEEKFFSAFRSARDFLEGNADNLLGTLASLELQSLIINLCRNPYDKHAVLETPSTITYKAIIETMEREVLSNLLLDDIAKEVNISKSYLKTLFEKYCDLSPKEYYRRLRLREGIRLLNEGHAISTIAELMNFSYPNHFTEFFKKETGMTPTEHRERYKKIKTN